MSAKAMHVLLLAGALAACGCGNMGGGPADPKYPLAGTTWVVEEASWNGETSKPEKPQKVRFDDGTNQVNLPDGFMGYYSMDAKSSPKTISIQLAFPQEMAGQMAIGIWERDGDKLKLAFTTAGKSPVDFKTRPGDLTTIYTLKRAP